MSLTVLSVAYPLARAGADAAGGAEQVLWMIDRALMESGWRSVVIACEGSAVSGTLVPCPAFDGWLEDAREAAHQTLRALIAGAISRFHVDLVHMHGFDFHEYLPQEGVPVLATLHLPPEWYPERAFHLPRPDTWLQCVSESQRRRCPPCRTMLGSITNGIAVDRLQPRRRKRNYVLALGRICPEKGFHDALDAAALAGVPMILAGELFHYREHENYFERELRPRLAKGKGRYAGPVGFARKRRLLAGARCLLAPSLVPETSSLVAMEAMACGTPVIAYRSGALSEVVEHGRTGLLVNNAGEMAAAIGRSASIDPETCRTVAREKFSAERMVREYMALYGRLAGVHHYPSRGSCLAGSGASDGTAHQL